MNTIGSAGLIARAGAGRVWKQTRLPPAWVDGGDGSYVTRTPSPEGSALRVNHPDAVHLDQGERVVLAFGPVVGDVRADAAGPDLLDAGRLHHPVLAPEALVLVVRLVARRLELVREQVPRRLRVAREQQVVVAQGLSRRLRRRHG